MAVVKFGVSIKPMSPVQRYKLSSRTIVYLIRVFSYCSILTGIVIYCSESGNPLTIFHWVMMSIAFLVPHMFFIYSLTNDKNKIEYVNIGVDIFVIGMLVPLVNFNPVLTLVSMLAVYTNLIVNRGFSKVYIQLLFFFGAVLMMIFTGNYDPDYAIYPKTSILSISYLIIFLSILGLNIYRSINRLKIKNAELKDKIHENEVINRRLSIKQDELYNTSKRLVQQKKYLSTLNKQLLDQNQKVERQNKEIGSQRDYLKQTLMTLKKTQYKLVQSKKMASLGQLTAGIAHEINTPIGVSLSAASNLMDATQQLNRKLANNKLTREDLDEYLFDANESSKLLLSNLDRAASLVKSFKEVSIDQSIEELRSFELVSYLKEVKNSLSNVLNRRKVKVQIKAQDIIELKSYPGAFAQIFTNLIMNSIQHGFEDRKNGLIDIEIIRRKQAIEIHYQDNGRGIPHDKLNKIFEPFFTSKRGQGGSGLGMHIVYNLVTQKLGGSIKVSSEEGKGVNFRIDFVI